MNYPILKVFITNSIAYVEASRIEFDRYQYDNWAIALFYSESRSSVSTTVTKDFFDKLTSLTTISIYPPSTDEPNDKFDFGSLLNNCYQLPTLKYIHIGHRMYIINRASFESNPYCQGKIVIHIDVDDDLPTYLSHRNITGVSERTCYKLQCISKTVVNDKPCQCKTRVNQLPKLTNLTYLRANLLHQFNSQLFPNLQRLSFEHCYESALAQICIPKLQRIKYGRIVSCVYSDDDTAKGDAIHFLNHKIEHMISIALNTMHVNQDHLDSRINRIADELIRKYLVSVTLNVFFALMIVAMLMNGWKL